MQRITAEHLDQVLHPQFGESNITVLTSGLAASPGAAVGRVYLDADRAVSASANGEKVILVRNETSPDDIHGMQVSQGILTARGGLVSHAAVVARGWGIPAVVGAEKVQLHEGRFTVGDTSVAEGDVISLNGSTGEVVLGAVALVAAKPSDEFDTILGWADRIRKGKLAVRANADNGPDAANARSFGAEGIGLCRTEHMFLADDRLPVVRRMILADTPEDEEAALDELHKVQKADFLEILEAMDGLPVTVRLLDPPLHEFLPAVDELEIKEATVGLTKAEQKLLQASRSWHEFNPMLGVRGVRLGVVKPGLYAMQVRALVEAAVERQHAGGKPIIEVMIPLTISREELELARGWVTEAIAEATRGLRRKPRISIGTMVETPRGGAAGGRDRRAGRLLQLRHQRPHPDDVRLQPRRHRGPAHEALPRAGAAGPQPLRDGRRRRRGRAGAAGRRARAGRQARPQAGRVRRARRRPRVHRHLLRRRPRLRVVLALPGADRQVGGGAGRARRLSGRRPDAVTPDVASWQWATFLAIVVGLLLVELLVVQRRPHAPPLREAVIESAAWIAVSLAFGLVVWNWFGSAVAGQYYTAYLLEKSLSVDNVFVWALILTRFAVPVAYRARVLFYGVFGALVLRALCIAAGIRLLDRFEALLYVFGAFLVVTSVRMLAGHEGTADPAEGARRAAWCSASCQRPTATTAPASSPARRAAAWRRLCSRCWSWSRSPTWCSPPTRSPRCSRSRASNFVAFSSNAFAVCGLRALYFCLEGARSRLAPRRRRGRGAALRGREDAGLATSGTSPRASRWR